MIKKGVFSSFALRSQDDHESKGQVSNNELGDSHTHKSSATVQHFFCMGCIIFVVADFNHNSITTLFQSRPEVRVILGLLVTLWPGDLEGSD
jgi:hypothetical protein